MLQSLQSFSGPVHSAFTVKICLDTNILNYFLDVGFPSLNRAISLFVNCSSFVRLVTTRYVLFELLEVRKRIHFSQAYENLHGNVTKLSLYNQRIFYNPHQKDFYYSLLPKIKSEILAELNSLKDHTDIELVGDIHEALWSPTEHICLSSRLNREDTLVLTSTLMPDSLLIEDFVAVLTNDKNFNRFFNEMPDIDTVFGEHSLKPPIMGYIQNLKDYNKTEFNLTVSNDEAVTDTFILNYIKNLIIQKNKALFVGFTESVNFRGNPQIIVLTLNADIVIEPHQYLVIISKDLDFVLNCPVPITEYRDFDKNLLQFPISGVVNRIALKWPELDVDDPSKVREAEILHLIKRPGNMVFIHPDS